MKVVTLKADVRLIDLWELEDGPLAVLSRHKVRTLADWDRLLERRAHECVRYSPAAVLFDLSNYRLDRDECERAVAVLAAARQEVGTPCPR